MAGTERGKTLLGDQEVKHFPSLGARETLYMRKSLHGGQRGRGCHTIISLATACLKNNSQSKSRELYFIRWEFLGLQAHETALK